VLSSTKPPAVRHARGFRLNRFEIRKECPYVPAPLQTSLPQPGLAAYVNLSLGTDRGLWIISHRRNVRGPR
jgi:hypothetical protein